MSKQAITKADKAVQVAYTTVRQWEDKARDARSKAADLEADSGREILAGASAHEIAVKINAADLEAKAYDNAATEARTQLAEARTALLKAHAAEYDQQAEKARQSQDQMDEEVESLLARARELTGEDFEIVDRPLEVGEVRELSKFKVIHRAPMFAANAAAWIRCRLATGHDPRNSHELLGYGGSGTRLLPFWEQMDGVPPVFSRLAELEAVAELDDLEPEQGHQQTGPDGAYEEDALDPVEDADIIALTGASK